MDKNLEILNDLRIEKTKRALEKNNFNTVVLNDEKELLAWVQNIVEENSKVAVGGSQTLFETGVIDLLRTMNISFIDRYQEGLTREQTLDLFKEAFFADYFITSSNAITEDGLLYNVDGTGNRVAALTFGPKHVIVVAGTNKIVKNLESAKERVCMISAPANAIRLNKETPCSNFGECENCHSKDRICSHYVVTGRQSKKGRISVVLLRKNFGY